MSFGPYLGFSGRKDLWHLLKMVEDDEDAPSARERQLYRISGFGFASTQGTRRSFLCSI